MREDLKVVGKIGWRLLCGALIMFGVAFLWRLWEFLMVYELF